MTLRNQNGRADFDQITPDDLDYQATNGTSDVFDAEPFVDALRDGYIVAVTRGYHEVIDPREETDDQTALQNANDNLKAQLPSGFEYGEVWIPNLRPDDTEWSVGSTVEFGPDSATNENVIIVPKGWGFSDAFRGTITTTITDGTPIFQVQGNLSGDNALGPEIEYDAGLVFDAGGNDCEGLRLKDFQPKALKNVAFRDFTRSSAAGVLTLDGAVNNMEIQHANFNHNSNGDGTARNIQFVNDTTNGPPGEIQIADMNSFNGQQCDIFSTVSVTDLHLKGGRTEGCEGTNINSSGEGASIFMTSGNLYVSSNFEFGKIDKVAGTRHQIFFEGGYINVQDGTNMGIASGDAVKVGSSFSGGGYLGYIQPDNISGDTINIQSDPGSTNRLQVPDEAALDGSVTYPSLPWNGVFYHNGWQKYRTFSDVTVTSNGTSQLDSFLGAEDTQIDYEFFVDADLNADPQVTARLGWLSGNDQQRLVGKEHTGNAGPDIGGVVYRKGAGVNAR